MAATPPPPPRVINVQKFSNSRAGELASLHAAVSASLAGDFRLLRAFRRRTTGHAPCSSSSFSRKRFASESEEVGRRKKESRKVRRRRELSGNDAELGFSVSADGTKRLRTHVWYAKRFEMGKRWGFYLPICMHGRGRGSRAVLRWLREAAVVHDASYFIPIRLEGSEGAILSAMNMVLHPSPEKLAEYVSNQVARGVCYGNAMLWQIRPPQPQIVGPVTYMWRPNLREDTEIESRGMAIPKACGNSSEGECSSLLRQLLIWIHPSAFDEGLDALRFACENQVHEYGVKISCSALDGQLARLEVTGAKAMQVLQRTLHQINEEPRTVCTSTLEDPPLASSISSNLQKTSILEHAKHLPSRAILSLRVHDPREVSFHETNSSPKAVSSHHGTEPQEEILPDPNIFTDQVLTERGIMLSKPGSHDIFLSDCVEMWNSSHRMDPPIADNILCAAKHSKRLKSLYLDSGDRQGDVIEGKDCFGQSCPIILLRHAKEGLLSTGWTLVLPLCWVKPFWFSLISNGAHAIGLRERQWIASKNGKPSFPYDFPDCRAYSLFMADEAAAINNAAELRPAAVRPLGVPLPPPWDCIMSSVHKGHRILTALESPNTEPSATNDVAYSKALVPRTIYTLRQYLNAIDSEFISDSDTTMAEDGTSELTGTDQPNLLSGDTGRMVFPCQELCLVRVMIRAFKEGFFEDGAIVCAPLLSDLAGWKTRSEEEEEQYLEQWQLQISKSYVESYFTQLDSGKWELQLPEDQTRKNSFRWPIGFITTGFVHGSNGREAAAIAFCEAKLLAMLRRQQWKLAGIERPEIFVLVCNMRSTAYRRALATIVLDQQSEDLEFL